MTIIVYPGCVCVGQTSTNTRQGAAPYWLPTGREPGNNLWAPFPLVISHDEVRLCGWSYECELRMSFVCSRSSTTFTSAPYASWTHYTTASFWTGSCQRDVQDGAHVVHFTWPLKLYLSEEAWCVVLVSRGYRPTAAQSNNKRTLVSRSEWAAHKSISSRYCPCRESYSCCPERRLSLYRLIYPQIRAKKP
jgi:hypothetical protein